MDNIITIPPGKSLTFLYDQRIDQEDLLDVVFELYEASKLEVRMIFAGHSSSACNIKIVMMGMHAQASVRGAYFLRDEQKLAVNVVQEHVVGTNESHVVFKGALAGSSLAEYAGTVVIKSGAAKSNASQENKNLLLSPTARARSVPNLEALTNDIKCAHGSAVGQLDFDQLVYLQSRGIGLARAKELLLEGFFADIISADGELKKLVESIV